MDPLLAKVIGSFVRWVLVIGSGVLVERELWTQADATTFIAAAVPALVALIWSLYQKWRQTRTVNAALALPGGSTLKMATAVVNRGDA